MNLISKIEYKQPEVFQKLFRGNFPKLLLFARRYLKEPEAAADIAQECFIRLWNSQAEFPTEEKVVGFLYTTARNLSLDYLKHAGVISAHAREIPEESDVFFHESVAEEETYEMVYRAINMLASQAKRVMLLTLEGKSNPEIAELLGISVNSVRTHKQSAYKKLKTILQEYLLFFLFFRRK